MIEIHEVKRWFTFPGGQVRAVDGVSLSIEPGEFVALMGPSGSGKSTFLYLLGAMDKPSEGWISISGERLDRMNDHQRSLFRNRTLGFVFQSFHLLPRLNLCRNVELPMTYADVPAPQRRERATNLLRAVGLGDKLERSPLEISGGQCQRVAIARALANNPHLLLADEPTGNLDSHSSLEIMAIFQQLNRYGMSVVMVTHDETMAAHAHRRIRLKDGVIVAEEREAHPLLAALPADLDPAALMKGGAK